MVKQILEDKSSLILAGIVGSVAYGLNHEGSDVDIMGIFVAPTATFVGMDRFYPQETYHRTKPDETFHEIGKFIKLAAEKANPTLLELLYLDGYTTLTKFGKMLVDNRNLFLSNKVKYSYPGYCFSQAHKLNARGGTYGNGRNKRYKKHTRHLFRLLQQGKQLLETGELTMRIENHDEIFAMGELTPNEVVTEFGKRIKEFDTIKSVLPDKPDYEAINKILLKIRKGNY